MTSNVTSKALYNLVAEWAKANNIQEAQVHVLLGNLAHTARGKNFSQAILSLLRVLKNEGKEQPPDKKPISKAAKKRRIQEGGDSPCPFCGKEIDDLDAVTFEEIEPEEGGIFTQVAQCNTCGRRWKDEYKLIDVHELSS